jgi:hypothetical protein
MARWRTIESELNALSPRSGLRARESFWEDFRARASLHPQFHEAEVHSPYVLRWAVATAGALLLIAGASLHTLVGGRDLPMNNIMALDVAAPHRAVFIMNDKSVGGTILWIDCDNAAPTTGGAL